jgi:hypothetical protein
MKQIRKLPFTAAVGVLFFAFFLSGCKLSDFIPNFQQLVDETLGGDLPGMDPDGRPGRDKIVRVRCETWPANFAGIRCEAALSNGVSDLINDIHTGVSAIDVVLRGNLERTIKELAHRQCAVMAGKALDEALRRSGNFAPLLNDYITKQNVRFLAVAACFEIVQKSWNETNNDRYSDGDECAAGSLVLRMDSVNLPPAFDYSTFAIHQDNGNCPRERVYGPGFSFWGND